MAGVRCAPGIPKLLPACSLLPKIQPDQDFVGCFRPGSPHTSEPDFYELRQTLKTWKKEGLGFFNRNAFGPGHVFLLLDHRPTSTPAWDEVLRAFGVRGESTKIDEPPASKELGMMSRYVIGETRAVAAVNSYR